jgi:hypothetical protein
LVVLVLACMPLLMTACGAKKNEDNKDKDTKVVYSITFNSNGGTGVSALTQSVEGGGYLKTC